jgi:hypothetical protein
MTRLDPDTTRKVIASARLLSSDQPGEVAAALSAMGRLLPDGLSVTDLIERSLTPVPSSPPPPAPYSYSAMGWKQRARMARLSPHLNDWERSFLTDLIAHSRLSERQESKLKAILIKSEGRSS